MKHVLVLCVTIVSFSTARGDDLREQVLIDNAYVVGLRPMSTWLSSAFSPDGKILVMASTVDDGIFGPGRYGTTIFWDAATGKKLGTLDDDGGNSLWALAFTPDGRTLAGFCTGPEPQVCLWDVQTRKLTGRLKGGVRSMTFSADGTMLATECSAGGVSDVQIWGVKEEKVVATLKAKGPVVQAMTFSGDGKSLAVGYEDGTIRVWDVKTERETARLPGQPKLVSALAFEPGDRTLLSAGVGKAVCRWDLTTGRLTAMTSLKGAAKPYGLAFGPGLATLIMADEDGLSVWDTRTGAPVSNAKVGLVFAFSPDGKWIAAVPREGKAKTSRSIQVWAVGKPADK
jgi:WD40 repeat protein